MEKFVEKIIDISTGEETIREYTKSEIAEIDAARELAIAENLAVEAKIQSRLDILKKLGLTDDEAAILLN